MSLTSIWIRRDCSHLVFSWSVASCSRSLSPSFSLSLPLLLFCLSSQLPVLKTCLSPPLSPSYSILLPLPLIFRIYNPLTTFLFASFSLCFPSWNDTSRRSCRKRQEESRELWGGSKKKMWLVINFMSKWAEFDKYDTVSNHPQFLGSNIIIVEWFPVFFIV